MGAYMHLMYVFVWRGGGGGGGSTQTNIVRLKQNVDNWRRPLKDVREDTFCMAQGRALNIRGAQFEKDIPSDYEEERYGKKRSLEALVLAPWSFCFNVSLRAKGAVSWLQRNRISATWRA